MKDDQRKAMYAKMNSPKKAAMQPQVISQPAKQGIITQFKQKYKALQEEHEKKVDKELDEKLAQEEKRLETLEKESAIKEAKKKQQVLKMEAIEAKEKNLEALKQRQKVLEEKLEEGTAKGYIKKEAKLLKEKATSPETKAKLRKAGNAVGKFIDKLF